MTDQTQLEQHLARLKKFGIVDMHFDLLMDLYEKRGRSDVLRTDFEAELDAGNIGVLGAAIFLEDEYLGARSVQVGLDQVARLYAEVDTNPRFAICRTHDEIVAARAKNQIAALITMEGVEPLNEDLNILRVFYELGLRVLGLTHMRRNAAGAGGVFAPSGSPRDGITEFGRAVVRECERLGILVDLAHISPAGFEDVLSITKKPVVISHTNPRKYYNIERNSSDDQLRAVGARGGVVGINAVLVSADPAEATLDNYVEQIEYAMELVGEDGVGIGFDFFEFIYRNWSPEVQAAFRASLTDVNFVPDLRTHAHAQNLTRKLIQRGFSDDQIEKILYGNWMRVFKELL